MRFDDLRFKATLSGGSHAKVFLAEEKINGRILAVKMMQKRGVIACDETPFVHGEKRTFLTIRETQHPFLLQLHAAFQTEAAVFLTTEYMAGGDLMVLLQRQAFSVAQAQLYAAEICLALACLHDLGIIHREVKLENVLLAASGHIKLAGYHVSKSDMWPGSTTRTFCGSSEFFPPEMLLDGKYDKAVDWWGYGVVLYQMLFRCSPFLGDNEDEIYDAILSQDPTCPNGTNPATVSILGRCFARDPKHRIGSSRDDAHELMRHEYFANMRWNDLLACQITPSFMPSLEHALDVSNFDPHYTAISPDSLLSTKVESPTTAPLSCTAQAEFDDFDYMP